MKKYGFGVDIGGTACKLGLFDEQGGLIEKWEIPTHKENNGESILPEISEAIKECEGRHGLSKDQIIGIGVGIPGPVTKDGMVGRVTNIGWENLDVVEVLSSLTGFRVVAGNDANIAALGELRFGCGRDKDSLVLLTIGTGVGGGIVIDGKILCGKNGAAGEVGHIKVSDTETECCGCGKKGCLEQYASATGIVRITTMLLDRDPRKSSLRGRKISAKMVFDEAKAGDEIALEIVDTVGKMLGEAMANIAVTIDPDMFAIGGGVSRAGNILIDAIRKHYKPNSFPACKETLIELAQLGNDAGIFGCVGLLLSL